MEPIILTIQVLAGNERIILANKEYIYQDIDAMEIQNDGLAYKIAEIAREELERINKIKFFEENPEYHSSVDIDELKASIPY